MKRILLADDHPLFRQALRAVIAGAQPAFTVEEADTLESAQNALEKYQDIELVMLDLKMPDCRGFSGLLTLRALYPLLPIIIVSASQDSEIVSRAITFGAAGFIPKSATYAQIAEGLEAVMAGDVWAPVTTVEKTPWTASIASLTPSQLKILTGLQRGLLNKQIAAEMGISSATVKVHMSAMFRKLGVMNRTQAAVAAEAMNLPLEKNEDQP
jgi:DNA-binding NarL/FixJ family response regulator